MKKVQLYFYILCLLPLLAGLCYSLLYSLEIIGRLSEGMSWHSWIAIIDNFAGWKSLLYTFILAFLSTILSLIFSLMISWLYFKGQINRYVSFLLFFPLAFPPIVAALAWFTILEPTGLISRLTFHLGITNNISDFPRLVQDTHGVGILFTHIYLVAPVFSLWFIRQIKNFRIADLYFTASTLGASDFNFFTKVYVPYLVKSNLGLILIFGIFLLGIYEVAILLGTNTTRVMTIFILDYLTLYNLSTIPLGHAWLFLYVVLLMILAVFSFRFYSKTLR